MIAAITDHVAYANANRDATALVDAEIAADPGVYPSAEVRAKLVAAIVENPMLNGQCLRLDAGQRFAPR